LTIIFDFDVRRTTLLKEEGEGEEAQVSKHDKLYQVDIDRLNSIPQLPVFPRTKFPGYVTCFLYALNTYSLFFSVFQHKYKKEHFFCQTFFFSFFLLTHHYSQAQNNWQRKLLARHLYSLDRKQPVAR